MVEKLRTYECNLYGAKHNKGITIIAHTKKEAQDIVKATNYAKEIKIGKFITCIMFTITPERNIFTQVRLINDGVVNGTLIIKEVNNND